VQHVNLSLRVVSAIVACSDCKSSFSDFSLEKVVHYRKNTWALSVFYSRYKTYTLLQILFSTHWFCTGLPQNRLIPRLGPCTMIFSARQHIRRICCRALKIIRDSMCRARYLLSTVRLSVCLSHGWISQKRLTLG